jgi:glycogen debranching enzyme
LQTNRRGSYALGTVDRVPRRKYHSLLTVREPGFGDSLHVLAGTAETLTIGDETYFLHSIQYEHAEWPGGERHLISFDHAPEPAWEYSAGNLTIRRSVHLFHNADAVRITYAVEGVQTPLEFTLQPLLTFRPMHGLTVENPVLDGQVYPDGDGGIVIAPYAALPSLRMSVEGETATWETGGWWHKGVFYSFEDERGYDAYEDYFSPGVFKLMLYQDATFSLLAAAEPVSAEDEAAPVPDIDPLARAAQQYRYATKSGLEGIIAGYPWFGEWGRDTMIALPGICISTGRYDEARAILEGYGSRLANGLIPNVPADSGGAPNTNAIDASLLYVRAVQLLRAAAGPGSTEALMPVVVGVLGAVLAGADKRVRVTPEAEIWVDPGPWAMTWMDALVDGWPVTPRHGFAVDVNALFYNALGFVVDLARESADQATLDRFEPLLNRAGPAFMARFWLRDEGYLADCHNGLVPDRSLRPNQLWALGLPHSPVPQPQAIQALAAVRLALVTPVGLRTLAPSDARYQGRYEGTQRERDLAYHQGTVWPWLIGIYGDAVLRCEGPDALKEALAPIVKRLRQHMDEEACLGQISEVFDGDEPHRPAGAPAQAWSVGEVLRMAGRVHEQA